MKDPELEVATVRPATPADADALARLRYRFRSQVGEVSEGREEFVRRCGPWMASRLKADSPWRCWVATMGGRPIGQIWVQLIEKVPNPVAEAERHAYITNFFVDGRHRGRGTGTALLDAALEWSRAATVHAVILWPTAESRPIYERRGFSTEGILQLIDATPAA